MRELRRLQSENDILVGKHNAKSQEMAADAINLPEGAEEMQLMLLKLREDLIAAKVGGVCRVAEDHDCDHIFGLDCEQQ